MATKKNNFGDTIVEVMIAIVVLGASIGGAFAIANKSQLTTQANHERYQAQLYANEQAELLRQAYATHMGSGTRNGFSATTSGTGCFAADQSWVNGAACKKQSDLYTIEVTRLNAGAGSAGVNPILTYSIKVNWDRIGGGNDTLELVYGV